MQTLDIRTVIAKTETHIKETFSGEGTGHDWHHMDRVRKLALKIAEQTPEADASRVELIALLHDLGDHKFHNGTDQSDIAIGNFLRSIHTSEKLIQAVVEDVQMISFKGAGAETKPPTLEGQIVQDADRLDAIGAIGIARAFAYGGSKHRPLYIPGVTANHHENFEAYKNDQSHTVNHFYEKLLLLKTRMNTLAGRQIAQQRHLYMEGFLQQFFDEWDAKK